MEHVIRRTLEAVVLTTLHPRTGITVVVQVSQHTPRDTKPPRSMLVTYGVRLLCAHGLKD